MRKWFEAFQKMSVVPITYTGVFTDGELTCERTVCIGTVTTPYLLELITQMELVWKGVCK